MGKIFDYFHLVSATDTSLSQHDRKYHPEGYNGGQCEYRDKMAIKDKSDKIDGKGNSGSYDREMMTLNAVLSGSLGLKTEIISQEEAKNRLSKLDRKGIRTDSVVTPEEDAAYMDAVKRGDMDAARRMALDVIDRNIKPTEYVEARWIQPVNGIEDHEKYESLVKDFSENGWNGRPVLAWNDDGHHWVAFTGSHRIAAAIEAGIDVPVYEIPRDAIERGYRALEDVGESGDYLISSRDDYERSEIFQRMVDEFGIEEFSTPTKILNMENSIDSSVTYDDNGEVIPLSRRFNRECDDIRFMSVSDLDGATRRAETLSMSGAELAQLRFIISNVPKHTPTSADEIKKECALRGVVGTFTNEQTNGKGVIRISKSSLNEMLNGIQVGKSASVELHQAVALTLPSIIRNAETIENHYDYPKDEKGGRPRTTPKDNGVSLDVMYAVVDYEGKPYRVKIRVKRYEDRGATDKAYSYDVKSIEVDSVKLEQTVNSPFHRESTSMAGSIVLNGCVDVNGIPYLSRKSMQNDEPIGIGKVAGWYDRRTGGVTLVDGLATAKTVAHEIGWHATFHWVEKNHPQLHAKLVEYAKTAPDGITKSVKERYGRNLSEDELLDEIGAERFTREHLSALLEHAQRKVAEGWFDNVEGEQNKARRAFIEAHKGDFVSKSELDEVASLPPSQAVSKLVELMLNGRRFGSKAHTESQDGAEFIDSLVDSALGKLRSGKRLRTESE